MMLRTVCGMRFHCWRKPLTCVSKPGVGIVAETTNERRDLGWRLSHASVCSFHSAARVRPRLRLQADDAAERAARERVRDAAPPALAPDRRQRAAPGGRVAVADQRDGRRGVLGPGAPPARPHEAFDVQAVADRVGLQQRLRRRRRDLQAQPRVVAGLLRIPRGGAVAAGFVGRGGGRDGAEQEQDKREAGEAGEHRGIMAGAQAAWRQWSGADRRAPRGSGWAVRRRGRLRPAPPAGTSRGSTSGRRRPRRPRAR